MYRAVLLDVFGTLVRDDGAGFTAAAHEVAARSGAAPGEVERDWEARLWRMADTAHGAGFRTLADLNAAALAETASHFGVRLDARSLCEAAVDRSPPLFADALPFLAGLEVPVCLVSDADREHLDAVLARHGIAVAHVVTSEDVRAYKPRPEPFRRALSLLGRSAGEVVHVGDNPAADLAGAAALGIDVALIDRRSAPDGAGPFAQPGAVEGGDPLARLGSAGGAGSPPRPGSADGAGLRGKPGSADGAGSHQQPGVADGVGSRELPGVVDCLGLLAAPGLVDGTGLLAMDGPVDRRRSPTRRVVDGGADQPGPSGPADRFAHPGSEHRPGLRAVTRSPRAGRSPLPPARGVASDRPVAFVVSTLTALTSPFPSFLSS